MSKLKKLAEIEGYESVRALLEASALDCVCPSICSNPGCDYTTEMEPDQQEGWCECCDTNTVKSALILAGWI